jgi:rare lipoprotein A
MFLATAHLPVFAANEGTASFYPGVRAGEFTAAHRSLPFGTRVRVTRIGTEKSVIVRINDRGPFIAGRIIDVSRRAAEELQMISAGVARVKVEVVEDAAAQQENQREAGPSKKRMKVPARATARERRVTRSVPHHSHKVHQAYGD